MDAKAVLTLIEELAVLKRLPRTGWRLRGITDAESVADHCYRMSTLSMILADVLVANGVALDVTKIMRMALLHEFGEARIGDIPYPAMRHLPADVKKNAEMDAVASMIEGMGAVGDLYFALWREFEEGDSLEAKLVRAVDKLEMLIQANEYEQVGYECLNEFWTNVANMRDFEVHPIFREILERLLAKREARRAR